MLVRDVSNRLDLEANDGVRGDREMTTCEMMGVVRGAEREMALAERRRRLAVERDLHALLGLPPSAAGPKVPAAKLPPYCYVMARIATTLGTAKPDSTAQPMSEEETYSEQHVEPPPRKPAPPKPVTGDSPRMVPLKGVPALARRRSRPGARPP